MRQLLRTGTITINLFIGVIASIVVVEYAKADMNDLIKDLSLKGSAINQGKNISLNKAHLGQKMKWRIEFKNVHYENHILYATLLPHQITNSIFDVAISFKGKADFRRTSRRLIQENLTQHLGEIATPFGDNETGQSAHKKIFVLALASPTDFFMHISPCLVISKFELVTWCGNNK